MKARKQTPRARRRDANLTRILDAAMELIARDGLDALSMGRLAEAVDYTPGALYRYFTSKDALLAALVKQSLEALEAKLELARRNKDRLTPTARVFVLAHAYRAFAKENVHAFGLLASTLAEPRVLLDRAAAKPVFERALSLLERVAAALGEALGAKAEGPEAPSELERTLVFFSTLQGLLQLQKQARFASDLLDLRPLVTHAVKTLLLGWGVRASSLETALAQLPPEVLA